MATPVVTLHKNDQDADGNNNPFVSVSRTPTANTTQLVMVTTRGTSAHRPAVVSDGGSLTWTEIVEIQHDTGGTLSYMAIWRAESGSSPGSETITITCPTNPGGILYHWVEVENLDLTTDNGLVQYATNLNASGAGTITSTFSATPATDAVIVSFCSIQESNNTTFTEDSGFTELSKIDPSSNEQSAVQYEIGGSPGTGVTGAWASQSGPIGIISLELAAESSSSSHTGAATLSGTGSLAGDGVRTTFEAATLTGAGSLSAVGSRITFESATLSGTGTLTADGTRTVLGLATLTGLGSLSASGTVAGTIIYGVATLPGVGALTAAGSVIAFLEGVATLTGLGSLRASGFANSNDPPVDPYDATLQDVVGQWFRYTDGRLAWMDGAGRGKFAGLKDWEKVSPLVWVNTTGLQEMQNYVWRELILLSGDDAADVSDTIYDLLNGLYPILKDTN